MIAEASSINPKDYIFLFLAAAFLFVVLLAMLILRRDSRRSQMVDPDEEKIEAHRIHKKYANVDKEIPNLYDTIICPTCGSTSLLEGPSGGASVNMMCVYCKDTWNVTYLPFAYEIEPIGKTKDRLERTKNEEQYSTRYPKPC